MSALFEVPDRYAVISDDGLYRYTLGRVWGDPGSAAVFVMLNPSTADADQDDPTIRRCIGFAKALGCGALHVVNLYAYRATNPADLWTVPDPVGPDNDQILADAAHRAQVEHRPLIVAWGANARADRVEQVLALPGFRDNALALGVTKAGAPRHPLYLRADARAERWPDPATQVATDEAADVAAKEAGA